MHCNTLESIKTAFSPANVCKNRKQGTLTSHTSQIPLIESLIIKQSTSSILCPGKMGSRRLVMEIEDQRQFSNNDTTNQHLEYKNYTDEMLGLHD